MSQKGRITLKEYFEAGKLPNHKEFSDLIDSHLNQNDDQLYIKTTADGTAKYLGVGAPNPTGRLTVQAHGDEEDLISFENPGGQERWKISQNTNNIPGLNIGESDVMDSQLFIASGSGNVGIETMTPETKLEVNGAITVRDQSNQDGFLNLGHNGSDWGATIQYVNSEDHLLIKTTSSDADQLVIKNDGKIGINTATPEAHLHVNGTLKLQDGVVIDRFSTDNTFQNNSDQLVPTEKAVREYIRYNLRNNLSALERNATGGISTTSGGWINMPDMNLSIPTSGRPIFIIFKAGGMRTSQRSYARGYFRLLVNGSQQSFCRHEFHHNGWSLRDVTLAKLVAPGPGTHQISVQWAVSSGARLLCSSYSSNRSLIAIEI